MATRVGGAAGEQASTGCYVYGIVPAGLQPDHDLLGVGEPPSRVTTVVRGAVAALVSAVALDRPIGTADDLRAHQRVLDGVAAIGSVLPMRFGSVSTSSDAVADELLANGDAEFRAALAEIDGRIEFVVKGRYVQDTILREILAAYPEVARLREQIQGLPEDVTHPERIALGEAVEQAVDQLREDDTAAAQVAVADFLEAAVVRDPAHEWEAINVAMLVARARADGLRSSVDRLAAQWEGRVNLRLLGPLAPYDFVPVAEE